MTEFVGTALADEAVTEENIVLTEFSGGSIADLTDAIGDIFHGLAGDDRIESGAGNDIFDGGEGNEFPGPFSRKCR
jgi:Ca2+-binding RTX toxin-like protein